MVEQRGEMEWLQWDREKDWAYWYREGKLSHYSGTERINDCCVCTERRTGHSGTENKWTVYLGTKREGLAIMERRG